MADSEYMLYLAKREGAESFSKHVVLTDYCERKFVSPVDAEREFDDLVASGGIRWHQVASGEIVVFEQLLGRIFVGFVGLTPSGRRNATPFFAKLA